ncbi:MAG: hemolysin III family protein, partial [Pseudomonadota bacterium]
FWSPSTGRSLPLYLGLGWASLLLIYPMALVLPLWSMILIAIGGLLYTVGAVLYTFKRLRFENAIWHSFVLTASGCFFSAIALAATAEPPAF